MELSGLIIKLGVIIAKRFDDGICKFDKHSHEKKVRVFSLENIHCSSSNQCPHDHSHNIIENKDPNRHKFKLNFF